MKLYWTRRTRSCNAASSSHSPTQLGGRETGTQSLASARQQVELRGAGRPIANFAEERVKAAEQALKKRVKRAVSAQASDYAALHEVRIAGKKLRYLLQFFSPVLDGGHQAVIDRLTVVQDELGTPNDLVTSEALLREYAFQLGEAKRSE